MNSTRFKYRSITRLKIASLRAMPKLRSLIFSKDGLRKAQSSRTGVKRNFLIQPLSSSKIFGKWLSKTLIPNLLHKTGFAASPNERGGGNDEKGEKDKNDAGLADAFHGICLKIYSLDADAFSCQIRRLLPKRTRLTELLFMARVFDRMPA